LTSLVADMMDRLMIIEMMQKMVMMLI